MPGSRSVLLAAALFSVIAVGSLADPRCASACSCAGETPIGDFDGPDEVVVVGRVGADDGSGLFTFHVERWFHGGDAATIQLASGSQRIGGDQWVVNTCGVELRTGDHLVVAMGRSEDGYLPSACAPHAIVESPQGARLIADAERAFGPGRSPTGDPVVPDVAPAAGVPLLLVAGVVLVVLLLGFAAVAAVRREDQAGPPPA